MPSPLSGLTAAERAALRAALRDGRVVAPYPREPLSAVVGAARADALAHELARLSTLGMSSAAIDAAVELVDGQAHAPRAQVVWSGPEGVGAATHDTGVTVRQLFGRAERRVLVAGFAVHQGREVFRVLAERMEARAELAVDLYLNVARARGDTTVDADLLLRFAARFRKSEWPGGRWPRVYYDPRALALGAEKQASLHAKCVVVDGRHVLVTSANFTEAAQVRNIELGLVVEDEVVGETIEAQFAWLVRERQLLRVPGL